MVPTTSKQNNQIFSIVPNSAILIQVDHANVCPDVDSPFELSCTYPKFGRSSLISPNDHTCDHSNDIIMLENSTK